MKTSEPFVLTIFGNERCVASLDNLEAAAKASEKVQPFLAGKTVRKVIVIPNKLVNIVVG